MKENNILVHDIIEKNLSEIEKNLFHLCSVPTFFTIELLDYCLKKLNIYEDTIESVAGFLAKPFINKEVMPCSKKKQTYYYMDRDIRKSVIENHSALEYYEQIISNYYQTRINAESIYEKKLVLQEKVLFGLKTGDSSTWRKCFQAAFEMEQYEECRELLSVYEGFIKNKDQLDTELTSTIEQWYAYYKLLFDYVSNGDELLILERLENDFKSVTHSEIELYLYIKSFSGVLYFASKNYECSKKIFKDLFVLCQNQNNLSKELFCSISINLLISSVYDNDLLDAKVNHEFIRTNFGDISDKYRIIICRALGLLKYAEYNLNESLQFYNQALESILEFQNQFSKNTCLFDVYDKFESKTLFCMDERHIYDRLGELFFRKGECKKAIEMYEKLTNLQNKQNSIGELWAMYNLGRIYCFLGNVKVSENLFKSCLDGFTKLSCYEGLACVYGELSFVYQYKGKIDESFCSLEKCLSMFLEQNKISEVLYYFNKLGKLYQSQGFIDVAHIIFHNCVQQMKYNNGDEHIGWLCVNYGRNSMLMHNYETAHSFLNQAKRMFSKSDNKRGLSFSLNALGELKLKQKKFTQSKKCLVDSLELKKEMGDKYALYHTICDISEYYIEVDKLDKAERYLKQLLKDCNEIGFEEIKGNIYLLLAILFNKKECLGLRNKYFRKAMKFYKGQNPSKRLYDCYQLFENSSKKDVRFELYSYFIKKKLSKIEQDYNRKNVLLVRKIESFIEQINLKTEN